jgi:hypothetical protein
MNYSEVKKLKHLNPSMIITFNNVNNEFSLELANLINSKKNYKIFEYITENKSTEEKTVIPKDISYDILGLHKKETVVNGDLIEVTYYGEYDENTKIHSNPVIKENRTYTISDNVYTKRDIDIVWYYDDETESDDTKHVTKHYDTNKGMAAMKIRRQNILTSSKTNLVAYLAMSGAGTIDECQLIGIAFLEDLGVGISLYADGNTSVILNTITNSTHTWLDNQVPQINNYTIRNLMLAELDV